MVKTIKDHVNSVGANSKTVEGISEGINEGIELYEGT